MEVSSPSLCASCQAVFEHVFEGENSATYTTSIERLKTSADASCKLCKRLWVYHKTDNILQDLLEEDRLTVQVLRDLNPARQSWTLYDMVNRVSLSQLRLIPKPSSTGKKQTKFLKNPSSNTKDALPLCKAWLEECLQKHDDCGSRPRDRTPTRLIYLSQSIQQNSLRIVESQELTTNPPYATLSHCWGKKPFLALLRGNYQNLRQHIPFVELRKTFQDAIQVALYLGFHYLWIDSLCIIQDDEKDWQKETSFMTSVYGNSTINIAASSANDGSIGCFFYREDIWDATIELNMRSKPLTYICIYDEFYSSLQSTPIASRGWVLQERVLPPRTIHFAKSEIIWECDKIACENFPDVIPPEVPFFHFDKNINTADAWFLMARAYSSCSLSFERDKLAAIAGLAKRTQSILSDDYLAGHWGRDLEHQLVWKTIDMGRLEVYTAPSWSWASIKGRVVCSSAEPFEELFVRFEDVKVKPVMDPFGAVSHGSLRLQCRHLKTGQIRLPSHFNYDQHIQIDDGKDEESTVSFDELPAAGMNKIEGFMAPIGFNHMLSLGWIDGLFLKPAGGKFGEYRRIGTFTKEIRDFKDTDTAADLVAAISANDVKESDCVEIRIDADGEKHYIIDII